MSAKSLNRIQGHAKQPMTSRVIQRKPPSLGFSTVLQNPSIIVVNKIFISENIDSVAAFQLSFCYCHLIFCCFPLFLSFSQLTPSFKGKKLSYLL